MSAGPSNGPGSRNQRLMVSFARAVGEAVSFERSEESVVRELVERLGKVLEPRSVVIQTARPDSPQIVAAEAMVALEQVQQGLCRLAGKKKTAAMISERGVRVRTALAGELPDILGLPGRLERAVANLLVNACQAGGKRSTARTWDNRDGTIGISVADSGEGIGEERLAQVMFPSCTARPDGQSIGLGLAVVQDAVDVHDGTVDIDSSEGEGTVVTITLPVRRPGRRVGQPLESADEA